MQHGCKLWGLCCLVSLRFSWQSLSRSERYLTCAFGQVWWGRQFRHTGINAPKEHWKALNEIEYCKLFPPYYRWIKSSWTILNCNKTLKSSHIATIFGHDITQLFKIPWWKFHVDDVKSDVTVASDVTSPIFSVQAAAARRQCTVRCWCICDSYE